MQIDPVRDSHPNIVRRGPVYLAFAAVLVAGTLGALIGYGLVRAACSETPSRLRQLLAAGIAAYHTPQHSCQVQYAGASLVAALIAAAGAGIVARLVLRAMTDWKKAPPREMPDAS